MDTPAPPAPTEIMIYWHTIDNCIIVCYIDPKANTVKWEYCGPYGSSDMEGPSDPKIKHIFG